MKQTYLNSFCARCLTLLVLALLSTNLAWGEELVYSTGFEQSEGFTTTSTNYATSANWGPTSYQWASVNGVVTTTAFFKLTGDQGFGMRKAKNETANSKEHSLAMNFNVEAYKIVFNAKTKNTTYWPSIKVLYSIDRGTSWTELGTHTFKGTDVESVSFELSNNITSVRFKIQGVDALSDSKNTYDLAIDDIKIYKKVAEGSHTISNIVNPVNAGSITLGSATVAEGATTTATANANEHFTFTGWSISGEGSTLSSTTDNPTTITMGTEDATITANFEEDTKYDVTFNANGGSGEMDGVSVYAGDYTLPECDFTKTGYKFVGWKANNAGELIAVGSSYTITNTAVEFYAQWEETTDITLSFDFVTHPTGWPTAKADASEGNLTYTINGIDYVFHASKSGDGIYMGGTSSSSGYLMLAKSNSLGLPTIVGYKLVKVVGQLNNSGSPSTKSEISITDGTNVVEGGSAQTWNKQGDKYTYTLSNTAANTMYYMTCSNTANCQIINIELTYEKVSSVDVTITAAKYATLGLPYAVTIPEGVSAYTATVNENIVTLNPIEGTIPANCGVILYAETPGTYTFTETADVDPIEGNQLVAVTTEGGKDINGTGEGIYFLSTNTNGVVFKLANSGNIPQYKAYLQSAGSKAKLDVVFGDPTGITSYENENFKAMTVYNLQGVRVNGNYKGIVIMNGKKYINK